MAAERLSRRVRSCRVPSELANALGNRHHVDALLSALRTPKHVAQRAYSPSQTWTRQHHTKTIVFNGKVGITLDAVSRDEIPAGWNDESMGYFFDGGVQKVTIRFHPSRYHTVTSRSINVRNQKYKPLTKAQLFCSIVKVLSSMLKEYQRQTPRDSTQASWTTGSDIKPSDIILTELRQVSKGSWQPVLFVLA